MTSLIRRALILWRSWQARKRFGREIANLRQAIEQAERRHRRRSHLLRRLREVRHAALRMEQGLIQ